MHDSVFPRLSQNYAWMGGEFGYPTADEVVGLLQAYQVGNAGLAQAVVRYKVKRESRAEQQACSHFDDYDSDDKYPIILPDEDEWYPFDRAAKKVTSRGHPPHTLLFSCACRNMQTLCI